MNRHGFLEGQGYVFHSMYLQIHKLVKIETPERSLHPL